MSDSILEQINRLRQMTTDELRREWPQLYDGQVSQSRNKQYLWRRLAWRVQELKYGGLSEQAKARLAELATDITFTRAETPKEMIRVTDALSAPTGKRLPPSKRDPRLPAAGTVITRNYRGRELRLLVHADGFELDGVRYGSLSEAAKAVTGAHWNGRLFFGLTDRRWKS